MGRPSTDNISVYDIKVVVLDTIKKKSFTNHGLKCISSPTVWDFSWFTSNSQ